MQDPQRKHYKGNEKIFQYLFQPMSHSLLGEKKEKKKRLLKEEENLIFEVP